MAVGEFNDNVDALLRGFEDIGVVGIVFRGLACDLQRRRNEDRVGRLDIHIERFIEGGDLSLRRLHVDAKRMIARTDQRGGIGQRIDVAQRLEIYIEIGQRFDPRKRGERSVRLQGERFEGVRAGGDKVAFRAHKPDEDAHF